MISRLMYMAIVGLVSVSCISKENRVEGDNEILGTYAREYSFKVENTATGEVVGMSTVRDTIFIKPKQNGYEVSNNKWRLNDFDREGWQNMEHAEDRPLRTYTATFDPTDNSLNAQFMVPLCLDKTGKLFRGKSRDSFYDKTGAKRTTLRLKF
jgi:hypothetical protein